MWPVLMAGPPWSTGWLRGQNGQKRTSSLWGLKPGRALGCCYMQKASGTTTSIWCWTKDSCCSTTNKVRWNFSNILMYGCEKAKTYIQFIHFTVILKCRFFKYRLALDKYSKIKFSKFVIVCLYCTKWKTFQWRQEMIGHFWFTPFKCKRFGNNHEDEGMTRKLEFFYEPIYGK